MADGSVNDFKTRNYRNNKVRKRRALLGIALTVVDFGTPMSGAETDGRLLAVRARFSRSWNIVDFLAYLKGYLQTNQLVMVLGGIEVGIFWFS